MRIRIIVLFAIYFFTGLDVSPQDIIVKKSGEEIRALIVDVSPGVIKYKKFDHQQGPVFAIAREQVDKIVYQNGKSQSFEKEEPDEIKEPDKDLQRIMPQKPSPVFGFHMAYGISNFYGDVEENKLLLASTLGASFALPAGKNNAIVLEADLLSIGCGIKDIDTTDGSGDRYELTRISHDMGYLSLLLLDRYFLNTKRNYFVEGGFYGSFLISASINGQAKITSSIGEIDEGSFSDDVKYLYNDFDFGIAGGLGGRIPLGKKAKWHISVGARFYYGLANILNTSLFVENTSVSNIYGLIFIGADLQTKSSK